MTDRAAEMARSGRGTFRNECNFAFYAVYDAVFDVAQYVTGAAPLRALVFARQMIQLVAVRGRQVVEGDYVEGRLD